jgi:hypothetical protein
LKRSPNSASGTTALEDAIEPDACLKPYLPLAFASWRVVQDFCALHDGNITAAAHRKFERHKEVRD